MKLLLLSVFFTLSSNAKHFYDSEGLTGSKKSSRVRYPASLEKCDGFQRVDIPTATGFCVGLVDDDRDPRNPLTKPRAITAFKDDLAFVDMGHWQTSAGRVFLLKKQSNGLYKRFLLITINELPQDLKRLLYMPSTIQRGPDGLLWVGATSTIFRFNPFADEWVDPELDTNPTKRRALRDKVQNSIQVMLENLPYKVAGSSKDSLHPLKPFVFEGSDYLYVGIGSESDNCGAPATPSSPCRERNRAALVLKYPLGPDFSPQVAQATVFAKGLRNPLAMTFHPTTGELWQAENSRDVRDANHSNRLGPFDELNLLREGGDYGWPYCEEDTKISREFAGGAWDCSRFEKPILFIPPHAGPLAMHFYTGSLLPNWFKNKLFITFHSSAEFGHRLVVYDANESGEPAGRPLNVLYNWGSKNNSRIPLGSPMGLAQASDGSLFITEDKNKKILRLFYDPTKGDGIPKPWDRDDEWIYKPGAPKRP